MALLEEFFRRARRVGRKVLEPWRQTEAFPNLVQIGRVNQINRLVYKAGPRNLRYFSRTPYPRRAINAIKNPIKMLDWEIAPCPGVAKNSEINRQIEIATTCFKHPNESDDFYSMIEQCIEDYLIGAMAIETQVGGDPLRPLWMWPVDGLSIQIYPMWDGNPNVARYAQTVGYGSSFGGGQLAWLRDDELMYVRPNPNTATPFGFGPLEIAFNSIARLLSVSEFAGNVAGNAKPSTGLDLGEISDQDLQVFRSWWKNDIEGQGRMPLMGSHSSGDAKTGGIKVLRLYPEGDDALYLKYQELLIREIGVAFDLSPQNFGIEGDVNRNVGEVAEDRDWAQTIKPTAYSIARELTRHAINGRLGFSQLYFRFRGLDREDEQATADIFETYYKNNAITPNEQRERLGQDPLDNEFADMTFADMQIAITAARGVGAVLDPNLPQPPPEATENGPYAKARERQAKRTKAKSKAKGR